MARGVRAFALLIAALALTACPGDTTFLKPGKTATDSTGPGGTHDTTTGVVQRAQLVVVVTVHGQDSALAARLGGAPGVVPKALVTVQRQYSSSKQVDTADGAGRAVFSGLAPGSYSVSVARLLTASETAAFDSANRDVNAFGGGVFENLSAPGDSLSVSVAAGRRGSLIISEVYDGEPAINGQGYNFAMYLEVYNNSDTTIYLDGKIVGLGTQSLWFDASNKEVPYSCEDTAPWRLDPDAIWSAYAYRFPGSGHEHPLQPGAAAVLATDAVDHSIVAPELPNLSHADFEFIGSTDADNPSVPNMMNITGAEFNAFQGHGLMPGFFGVAIIYLVDSIDLSGVPNTRLPFNEPSLQFYRIPRGKVLDVFSSLATPEQLATYLRNVTPCAEMINAVFDRQSGRLLEQGMTHSVVRRILGVLPDGRAILQRTGATANDFALMDFPTPGYVR